jgi:hypothetical protein
MRRCRIAEAVAPRVPPISLLSLSLQGGYLLFSSSAQGNPIGFAPLSPPRNPRRY